LIDQMDDRLRKWVAQILGPAEVSLTGPGTKQAGNGVDLYLFELANSFPTAGSRLPPLKLELRYLVTTWAETPEEAHRLLNTLVFAAMNQALFELDLTPLPAATWQAFAVAPRPAFILRVPLSVERPEPVTRLVTQPMVLKDSPLVVLEGQVVGAQNMPLAGAHIEIPFLNLTTYTNQKGWFRFPAVPAQPGKQHLRVILKGWTLEIDAERSSLAHEPLVIHFDPFEEKRE